MKKFKNEIDILREMRNLIYSHVYGSENSLLRKFTDLSIILLNEKTLDNCFAINFSFGGYETIELKEINSLSSTFINLLKQKLDVELEASPNSIDILETDDLRYYDENPISIKLYVRVKKWNLFNALVEQRRIDLQKKKEQDAATKKKLAAKRREEKAKKEADELALYKILKEKYGD